MNFIPKPVGNKLIIRFDGDLTWDIAKKFQASLSDMIKKEKKSIIFDFRDVKYISIDACEAFVYIYRYIALEQLELLAINVDETITSIFNNLGFQDIFTFAANLSSAMSLSRKVEIINSENQEGPSGLGMVVAGAQQSASITNEKSKNDSCANWSKKGFLGIFIKKCNTCRFFKAHSDNGKGECTR